MQEPQHLEDQIYSEAEILKLLDIDKDTLDSLRHYKGFPFVRLTSRRRVYIAEDVLDWIKQGRRGQE